MAFAGYLCLGQKHQHVTISHAGMCVFDPLKLVPHHPTTLLRGSANGSSVLVTRGAVCGFQRLNVFDGTVGTQHSGLPTKMMQLIYCN